MVVTSDTRERTPGMEQAQLRIEEWERYYWELIAFREGFVQQKGPSKGRPNRAEAMRLGLQYAMTHMPPGWRPDRDDPMPPWWHRPTPEEWQALGWPPAVDMPTDGDGERCWGPDYHCSTNQCGNCPG